MAITTVLLAALALAAPALADKKAEKLVFADEFDTLDEGKWVHQISAWRGGNQEFQFYRNDRKNSYVRDGILYIRPTLTADEFGEDLVQHGNLTYPGCNMEPCVSQSGEEIVLPIQSARLSTSGKFSFKYGRCDIRARLPRGDWIWPAMWLMPQKDKYGGWPRSGEIDLMESRGNANLKDSKGRYRGFQTTSSTLHFGPAWNRNRYDKAHVDNFMGDNETLANDFHVYSLEWSEKGFRFLLDGKQYGEVPRPKGGFWKLGEFEGDNIWKDGNDMAPFDQEFYIILNVAVGGTFFSDDLQNSPYPRPYTLSSGRGMRQFWEKKDLWYPTWHGEKAALQVDYVRVYEH
ncbi:beta-1,3-glucan-binding protein-like [Thrips palmi]|uniref:Beta-1,3-glucan-binding protein-like n=1 Tax=Thrips palmi TaxID=161013 RepID=A0A6P8YSP4_THRPL|nr:beta-1,3-glucan-binding protein-like [Thrips palmi]